MTDRYIAFDVETPNCANDRMSAIGIAVVEDGVITAEEYHLVDPECRFDRFNIELTGITPQLVAGEPNFGELWQQIEPVMNSGLLIAHNAPFDMGVLSKCLRAYGIEWKRSARYACTCMMSRACYPELPNHKLNTMCSHLGLALDHHNAGSDSRACAELLLCCLGRGAEIRRFARSYDLSGYRTYYSV